MCGIAIPSNASTISNYPSGHVGATRHIASTLGHVGVLVLPGGGVQLGDGLRGQVREQGAPAGADRGGQDDAAAVADAEGLGALHAGDEPRLGADPYEEVHRLLHGCAQRLHVRADPAPSPEMSRYTLTRWPTPSRDKAVTIR